MRLMRLVSGLAIAAFAFTACESSTAPTSTSLSGDVDNSALQPAKQKSLGKVTLDAEVSSFGIGSGIPNGDFIAEVQGVQIGLRAQERFNGLLGVTGDKGNRVAVYEAPTGPSPLDPGDNNGTWNYDFHVDLSNAKGKHAGKNPADYRLFLEQEFHGNPLAVTIRVIVSD